MAPVQNCRSDSVEPGLQFSIYYHILEGSGENDKADGLVLQIFYKAVCAEKQSKRQRDSGQIDRILAGLNNVQSGKM
jgi:hypothetical protein